MAGRITFTIVKPEAVAKEYTGHIFSMITSAGFHIVSMKMIRMTKEMAEKFYLVHKERPFYKDLVGFMSSGPVVVAILEKDNAVADYRTLIGATDPSKAADGTIRKKYAESVQNNAVHGSDSEENANIESDFFFAKNERFYL
jgi:nucleoside-diphosphate kinase